MLSNKTLKIAIDSTLDQKLTLMRFSFLPHYILTDDMKIKSCYYAWVNKESKEAFDILSQQLNRFVKMQDEENHS